MKGYFGIGVEGLSKAQNLGALMRTAHAFGAQFLFTVGAAYPRRIIENVLASPDDALTGPVARGDTGTIRAHLEALDGSTLGTVYEAFIAAAGREPA